MNTSSTNRKTTGPSRHKAGISASLRQDRTTGYVRNSKTISGRLHDELVMMDLDQGKYFSLNPVATRIWDLLDQPLALNDLCSLLVKEYEVDAERCRKEVGELLEEMVKLRLVLRSEV